MNRRPIRWKPLMLRLLFWIATEVTLNCLGIDDLADYGEYVVDEPHFSHPFALISQL